MLFLELLHFTTDEKLENEKFVLIIQLHGNGSILLNSLNFT